MLSNNPRILIVGAGASGCFCASQLREALPGADIHILEAGRRPLAKLSVTGGGRCNITNDFSDVNSLREVYPRGANFMRRALAVYSPEMLLDWFRKKGVRFITEDGGRVFPACGGADLIVRTLLSSLDGVDIRCAEKVLELPEGYDFTVVTTGGGPGMDILRHLPVKTEVPVPSLFPFRLGDSPGGGRSGLTSLMGTSLYAGLSIPGTSFRSEGELLITDWGLSGPAALRLSSYAARFLSECGYNSPLQLRWSSLSENDLRSALQQIKADNPQKRISSVHPEGISRRLWEYILGRCALRPDMPWAEMGSRGLNRLVSVLLNDTYYITGRTSFRGEFVTCGGVSLSSVNIKTLESISREGLYFAGEVLDVDAVTGGFNLQAAWSTAYIVAKSIISKYDTQNL